MERILTVEQMRNADDFTINQLGVAENDLVWRAGKSVADEIIKRFHGGRVLVCIGKGNNGADGKVIAELLSKVHGFTVATINVFNGIFKIFDKKFDIIVDCIFGTGLNRIVEGKYKTAIERINNSGAFVISCDIASGLNGNNGKVMGVAVRANLTIAIQEYKLGHFLFDGPDYSGEVIAKDIGISIWGDDYAKRLNSQDVCALFPKRNRNVYKGNFGKSCIIGGSKPFTGSVLLSLNALTALKMGIGYANLAVPNSLFETYVGNVPECTMTALKDDGENIICDIEQLNKFLTYNSIAVGMGIGISEGVYSTIRFLLENYEGNLIIDADGLNSIAKFGIDCLKNKKCKVVLTPHIGEFSRLCGVDKNLITDNPIEYAKRFAKEFDVIVLLKSAVSIVTDGNDVFLNTTGNSSMAKCGSGDVLSGIVAGLLARNEDLIESVAGASYLFGKAGELAVREQNEYTVTATDIIAALPKVINSLNK